MGPGPGALPCDPCGGAPAGRELLVIGRTCTADDARSAAALARLSYDAATALSATDPWASFWAACAREAAADASSLYTADLYPVVLVLVADGREVCKVTPCSWWALVVGGWLYPWEGALPEGRRRAGALRLVLVSEQVALVPGRQVANGVTRRGLRALVGGWEGKGEGRGRGAGVDAAWEHGVAASGRDRGAEVTDLVVGVSKGVLDPF